MHPDSEKFQRSITACIDNGNRLLEDAEWSLNPASTGLALALLAQEEAAKAFLLTLVRDGVLPWTQGIHRSLNVHAGKHLVSVVMEWLLAVSEQKLKDGVDPLGLTDSPTQLPPDVAVAMNIFRHELIEKLGSGHPERYDDWHGRARRLAEGKLDRKKQSALYVGVGRDGSLASVPPTSPDSYEEEKARARALIEFAANADRKFVLAFREYEFFTNLFREMFADLRPGATVREERFESDIPGVEFVRQTITVANVVNDDGSVPSGK